MLNQVLGRLRQVPYAELVSNYLNQPDCIEVRGPLGEQYQVEIDAFWDDKTSGNLRVLVAADQGRGWRAFSPLTSSFILAPDGSFVDED